MRTHKNYDTPNEKKKDKNKYLELFNKYQDFFYIYCIRH